MLEWSWPVSDESTTRDSSSVRKRFRGRLIGCGPYPRLHGYLMTTLNTPPFSALSTCAGRWRLPCLHVLGLVFGLGVTACGFPDPERTEPGCMLNSDCALGETCQRGTCLAQCREDRDCSPGLACVAGMCTMPADVSNTGDRDTSLPDGGLPADTFVSDGGDTAGVTDAAVPVEDVRAETTTDSEPDTRAADALPGADSATSVTDIEVPISEFLTRCATRTDCEGNRIATSCVGGYCGVLDEHVGGPGEILLDEWDADYDGLGSGGTIRPYGAPVGEFCGVAAYSNANSAGTGCFYDRATPMETFGIEYQCVEYVLRFLCLRFPELGCASTGRNSTPTGNAWQWWSDSGHPIVQRLQRFSNGGAMAPQPGDVLVYPRDVGFGGFGHVAIIRHVGVDHVLVIEQNVRCTDRDGERRVPMQVTSGRYTIPSASGWLRAPGPLVGCGATTEPECTSDTGCAVDEHCRASVCVSDVCVAGQRRCAGAAVEHCDARGSAWVGVQTCADGCEAGACVAAPDCRVDADCGAPETGTWSGCDYVDACDETAGRSRLNSTPRCRAGVCSMDTSIEGGTCTRDTDGSVQSTGTWGSCSGFSNACDTTGTQSRSVAVCRSGTQRSEQETRACSRTVSATLSAGPWSTCGGFSDACDETGTQTRTVESCSGDVAQSVVETRPCTRDTDGDVLSSGSWGSCSGYSSECDESGTQSRSVQVCTSGAGMTTVDSRSCTRDTDGNTCAGGRCTSGSCGSVAEVLNYLDDDGDGLVDEGFRRTLYRRGASNGYGYTNPLVDADHCWSYSSTGESCIGPEVAGYTYGYDGRSVDVYDLSIGSGNTVWVGSVLLSKLMQCWSASLTEHQSATINSEAYAALTAAGFSCTPIGYVKTGRAAGTDPSEVTMRVHRHDVASTTMYSPWTNEAQALGFDDRGAVWFAWSFR